MTDNGEFFRQDIDRDILDMFEEIRSAKEEDKIKIEQYLSKELDDDSIPTVDIDAEVLDLVLSFFFETAIFEEEVLNHAIEEDIEENGLVLKVRNVDGKMKITNPYTE